MSSEAPIEIWHTILKYAISVPLFFDDDPVAEYGIHILQQYSYEAPYWHAERNRNSLRRVCRGWDEFLSLFSHRFIRLDDVLHHHVPVTALPFAVRLDLDTTSYCNCTENCGYQNEHGFWGKMKQIWDAAPFVHGGKDSTMIPIVWRAEIVKGWIASDYPHYSILQQRAPGLKVLISQPFGELQSALELPKNLRLLTTDLGEAVTLSVLNGVTSLTVLHAFMESLRLPQNECNLPSLKHLSITLLGDEYSLSQEELFQFLEKIGSQLSTFHLKCTRGLGLSPVEHKLWEVLPGAESIALPYMWSEVKIPQAHPLQQIRIDVSELAERLLQLGSWEDDVVPYLPFPRDGRQLVRMDLSWNEELFCHEQFALLVQEHYWIRGILFVDAHGDSFSQYVVFLITVFWKLPKRKYHKSIRDMGVKIPEF